LQRGDMPCSRMLRGTTGTEVGWSASAMQFSVPPRPCRMALIGAGTVGTAVTELLRRRGYRVVGVASRTPASTERAAHRFGAPVFDPSQGVPGGPDLVLLGVRDAAIEPVARSMASALQPGTVVWHLAGSLGAAVLAPVTQAGALGCAIHPVQACPDVDTAIRRLPGSAWGITCSARLLPWATEVVTKDLAGTPVPVSEPDRVVWHSAAVTTANGIGALLSVGEAILTRIGIDRPERVLAPLAAGAVRNAAEGRGGAATLTGPAVRGEVSTIRRHLSALAKLDASLGGAYGLVTRLIVEAAAGAGRMAPERARSVLQLLDQS
jgi:predicted short-subunit dehydrogenase-like oxidoreductase (DUF2520 family)